MFSRSKAPSTRVLDLRGATIVPGFHDAHGHVVGLGASLQDVDLRGTSSYEEVVGRVRRRLASARPGEWIIGRGLGSERLGREDVSRRTTC